MYWASWAAWEEAGRDAVLGMAETWLEVGLQILMQLLPNKSCDRRIWEQVHVQGSSQYLGSGLERRMEEASAAKARASEEFKEFKEFKDEEG